MPNSKPPFTLEEFKQHSDHFRRYFLGKYKGDNSVGDAYRKQPLYVKCVRKFRPFAEVAWELRQRRDFDSEAYLERLYDAYVLMHLYAEPGQDIFAAKVAA